MALDGLERELRGRYPKASALSRKAKVNLVRYADDFIITGSSKKLLEEEVKPLVESFLKERGLELSAEKTHITRIEDGFDFLGQNVRDYGGTIVVKPSRKNVATFLEKVRGIIKASKHVTAGHLIVNLNPVIRGWANYHRHVASKQTFSRVDHPRGQTEFQVNLKLGLTPCLPLTQWRRSERSVCTLILCHITPARKFRILAHTNPTRQRGL